MRKSVFGTSDQKMAHFRKRDDRLTNEAELTKQQDFQDFMNKNTDLTLCTFGEESVAAKVYKKRLDERVEEAIVQAKYRPVMVIRNNKIVPEFAGPSVEYWKETLLSYAEILNAIIPAVGKVEVNNNSTYKWVGTGWLVDTDIIVTNRHVATKFCNNKEGFVFRAGQPTGTQSARMDFREEDEIVESNEFEIESVLWMSENSTTEPDIAFMRVARPKNGNILPKPLVLAEKIIGGELVVTIGYPARNPDLPDQDLIKSIFGEVFDKKRLAPGEIMKNDDIELTHDCSTLQGNSGSPVIELSTGKVMGLHFAGTFMTGNVAVSAPTIAKLLRQLKDGSLPRLKNAEALNTRANPQVNNQPIAMHANNNNKFTIEAMIPIKITVEIGGQVFIAEQQAANPNLNQINIPSDADPMERALAEAAVALKDYKDIISISEGYRFRRGWITDEKVVVVEVKEKQSFPDLKKAGKNLIPQEFNGIGVDVRTASLKDQLEEQLEGMGIDLDFLEAAPTGGKYKDPPHLELERFTDYMEAIFHVSPDSAWPNLEAFIERIEGKLTATIYEWESEHITKALVKKIRETRGHLKMVTQSPYTELTVDNVKGLLNKRFEHVYASTGKKALFPRAYHIKVATRDEEEFWLSSGNWKDSNQANIHPAGDNSTLIGPLRDHNREWHVIIKHSGLAKLFEEYINWDFDEAHRVPKPPREEAPSIDIFLPESAFVLEEEARKRGSVQNTLSP